MPIPSTHWSLLDAVRDSPTEAHRDALSLLAERYYYPALVHVRSRGVSQDAAENLVQGFFENCLQKDLFGRADRARGRFRNFFLTALDNFVRNSLRSERAQQRRPEGGFVSLDLEAPADSTNPDQAFYRAFAVQTVRKILAEVENDCVTHGQTHHFLVFRRRVVEPALDGVQPPSEASLAHELGITEKQAANYLVTVKRIFRRRLQAYVAAYAASEDDVTLEIKEMMGFFRWPE